MKKIISVLCCGCMLILFSCNNSDTKAGGNAKGPVTKSDSLMKEVMDGHDAGMAKYGKIGKLQEKLNAMLDSLGKLPEKAKAASAPLQAKLESALKEVNDAKNRMDVWMETFNMDSAVNDAEARIKYLTEEKLKVGGIRDAIMGSLAKADSLLTGQ